MYCVLDYVVKTNNGTSQSFDGSKKELQFP